MMRALHFMRGLLALLVCFTTASARAHPDLDRARALAAELDLLPALAAFDRALESGTLTESELVTLLAERALVHYGLRHKAEVESDLVWLSALAPDHRLDLRAPPELLGVWTNVRDQGRGRLRLALEARIEGGELLAETRFEGTVPMGLVPKIQLREGVRGFVQAGYASVRRATRPGARFGLFAEAVGLGGVVVARSYSEADPLELSAPLPMTRNEPVPVAASESWARAHRGWLIGGAVLLLAGAVTTVVLVKTLGDDQSKGTTLTPMVEF
jgi:hypothetical protein